jgi:hypothetical protein
VPRGFSTAIGNGLGGTGSIGLLQIRHVMYSHEVTWARRPHSVVILFEKNSSSSEYLIITCRAIRPYPCVDYYFIDDAVEAVMIERHHPVQAL